MRRHDDVVDEEAEKHRRQLGRVAELAAQLARPAVGALDAGPGVALDRR